MSFWRDIAETLTGRGQMRLVLQPTMAILIGLRMGVLDAKLGESPFLWRLATADDRRLVAKEAFRKVLIPLCIAIVLDGVLQYLTHGYVRPLAAIIVGLLLIFAPFAISRALTNRIYRYLRPTRIT
jgi:di/tricarboxylate transporter